jgi:broad specificity phosphatase PhoE/ribonuclease HI
VTAADPPTDGRHVVVEADGGARGNPGPAGYGAVVRDAETGEVLAERSASLGIATNNVAEYSGLIAGLSAAADLGAREVDVRMDSKLVIEQMCGRWQIKHPGLRPLAARAAALVPRFEAVRFGWIPRERNRHADALANRAMDEAAGTTVAAAPPARPSWEPQLGTPTRLVLVRHGETGLTAERRFSGRGDPALTPRGAAQAQATAQRVADLVKAASPAAEPGAPERVAAERMAAERVAAAPVAAVVTSPLARAAATAAAIAAALGNPPVTQDPDLIECDFGQWEGRTVAEVRERWPDEWAAWMRSAAVAPPGGESFRAVAARVRRSLARLRDAYPARIVVLVSHVTPIKLTLRDALAAGDAFLYRMHLDAGGLSIVDTWPDGGVSVRAVNETAHLSGVD